MSAKDEAAALTHMTEMKKQLLHAMSVGEQEVLHARVRRMKQQR